MCARRFLIMIVFATLLVVAGAFAIFQFGGDVLLQQGKPKGHFEAAKAGSGPDYSKPDSWLCHPNVGDDPCKWQPKVEVPYGPGRSAKVFYIHPTTYLEREQWNAPLRPGGETEFRSRLFAQSQASAFLAAGEVWAPRYRQAAFGAFLLKSEDSQKALDLAYGDVAAAFDQFLKEAGDAPIILAGHSQGALHLERLLREKVAGKPIAKRVVAAYAVGWPVSTTADLPHLGVPACTAPEQAGCVLSWMTYAEPANPRLILTSWKKTKGFSGSDRRQDDILCVNPVTGTQNGSDARGVGGHLVPSVDMRAIKLSQDSVGASCRKGLLIINGNVPNIGPFVLPGNNYHVYDFALFWEAIRQDALRRMAAWHR